MKNKLVSLLGVVSHLCLILGDLGLFFKETLVAGYILFALGCVLGLIVAAAKSGLDVYERFHLVTSIVGIIILGLFVFTGILYKIIVVLLVLFVVDFLLVLMNLKKSQSKAQEEDKEYKIEEKKYDQFNEKKLFDELENIKDEFSHVQIYESGKIEDIEDLSLRQQAEQIKDDLKEAVVVEDPKEGRYFYKETGKMFHVKGCTAIRNVNKKELKASNSRTELLAKGYKACKVCHS